MSRQMLSETLAFIAKVLLITLGTRSSMGLHLYFAKENVHLAKDEPAAEKGNRATEGVYLLSVGQAEEG